MAQPGLITLLSDTGEADGFGGLVRGIFSHYLPPHRIVDLSHSLRLTDTEQAAYLLSSAWRSFGPSTCHIVLAGSAPAETILLVHADGHYFIAPDNGILPLALGPSIDRCRPGPALPERASKAAWLHAACGLIKTMFDGLPDTFPGTATMPSVLYQFPRLADRQGIRCRVIHVPQGRTLVLQFREDDLPALPGDGRLHVRLPGCPAGAPLVDSPGEVGESEYYCRFNDAGYLEAGICDGDIVRVLGYPDGPGPQLFDMHAEVFRKHTSTRQQ